MKTTTNMGLNVPELTDVADITKLSSNFEVLDEKCVRTDGNNSLTGTNSFSGAVSILDSGSLAVNGPLTASNTGNSLKVANHDTALISNDVLSAKDINEVNGSANNLLHRSGDETSIYGKKGFFDLQHSYPASGTQKTWEWWKCEDSSSSLGYESVEEGDVDGEHGNITYTQRTWSVGSDKYYAVVRKFMGASHYYQQIWVYKNGSITYTKKFIDLSW